MCKRGENIYKRKDGRWECRFKKTDGRYIYVYGKSYTEVKEKKKERIKNEGSFEDQQLSGKKATEQLEKWLSDCYCRVKPSTYENYYYCIKTYICPYFENSKTNSFCKMELDGFVENLKKNTVLSYSYKNKILTIFRVALRSILGSEKDAIDMLGSLKLPKMQTVIIQVFSLEEQRKIEEKLIQYGNFKAFGILLCFYTGLRLGELCALTWKDINLEAQTVSVSGTLSRKKNFNDNDSNSKTILTIDTPKNNSSNRVIPLPDFLAELLGNSKQDVRNSECFLLSNDTVPLDPRTLQKYYKNVIKAAGVPYRKFHTLRHTFATRALEMGVDIKTVSDLLGHATVTNTLNIYAHSLMEQKKRAIAKFHTLHISQLG